MTIIQRSEYTQRRQQWMTAMQPNSIAIIPASPECARNADNSFAYRQNSDFYYLTGFNEPDAVAVFVDQQFILFNRAHDPVMAIWHGKRAGQSGAVTDYQADQAWCYTDFQAKLPELLKNREILYFAFGRQMRWDRILYQAINQLRGKSRAGIFAPETVINPEIYLHEQRLRKSHDEIKTIQKAVDIAVSGHIKAMQHCQVGQYEYELEAVITAEFVRQGSRSHAYSPIIGSGQNSCILHYQDNDRQMQNGDIVLIDAGCEYENYASDITRSLPVNGKFSPAQKAIYNLVLEAQQAAIQQIRPGVPWEKLQETVIKTLTNGLIDLKLLNKKNTDLTIFYMHSASHWLGLDTHDVGDYKLKKHHALSIGRPLEANMILTVEPGLYITPNPAIDPAFWHIGIRIEDDVLVTQDGYQILSQALPKEIPDIEAIMA